MASHRVTGRHRRGRQQPARSALAEPTVAVTGAWTARLSLAVLGFWIVVLPPVQVLLPLQIEQISANSKETSLAIVTGFGALASIVACPVAGALSDRTTSRFGRRKPWIALGVVACAGALVLQSIQATIVGVVLCWVVAQAAQNSIYAGLTATVPDQVPVRQRGFVSAWMGIPNPLALVLGVLLVTVVATSRTGGYGLLAALLVALSLPLLLLTKDARLSPEHREPFALRRFLAGFWVSPREHPDFAWAAGARLSIQLANSMATLYLLYFLRDVVRLDDPAQGVFVLTLVYTVGIVSTSVLAGRLSDRIGRRKVFVVVAACVVAAAMLTLSVWPAWPTVIVAAAVLGLGFGVYLAIDNALVSQVLPTAGARAKDLGVLNIANTAPQAIAPLLAGGIIAVVDSYSVLYVIAGAIALLAAVLVRPIRSVR